MTSNPVDEYDLVIINSNGEIVFKTGEGQLTNARKIVASLTQVLNLFSRRVIREDLDLVRFKTRRMIFINEGNLSAVKLVPRDKLVKEYISAASVITKFIANLLKFTHFQDDSKLLSKFEDSISIIYQGLANPSKTLFVISGDVNGYSALVILLAGIVFDLSYPIENVSENIIIVKREENYSFDLPNKKIERIFTLGVPKSALSSEINLPIIDFTNTSTVFNTILPMAQSPIEIIGFLFGEDSKAAKVKQLTETQEVMDVIKTIVEVPFTTIAVEVIVETIQNFTHEQRIAKPMYRLLVSKLREIEDKKQISKEKLFDTNLETGISTISHSEPKLEVAPPIQMDERDATASQNNLDNIANSFTRQLDSLTDSPIETSVIDSKIETPDQLITKTVDDDISSLKIGKYSTILEFSRVYVDTEPYMTNTPSFIPDYAPSIQIAPPMEADVKFSMIIVEGRSQIYKELLQEIADLVGGTIHQIQYGFTLTVSKENFYNTFRSLIWSLFIEYTSLVHAQLRPRTVLLEISNQGSICIIDNLTPERRKHLPSQITEILEEDKFIKNFEKDNEPVSIALSMDNILKGLSNPLKKGDGVGFVLRDGSNELPLIMQFILNLSEISGIGWSRW